MAGGLSKERLQQLEEQGKARNKQRKQEAAANPRQDTPGPIIGDVTGKAARHTQAQKAEQGGNAPRASMRCLEDVEAKPINWLWPGRIACGKLTLLAGDPGLGKSQITTALAAIVTNGGFWPVDGSKCRPGSVVFLSAEDDAADTIKPRLEAVGANLKKCFILDAIQETDSDGRLLSRAFSLKNDLIRLYYAVREIGDVRLIVIDPITAYMGGVDSHKNTDVRAMLTPISEFAEACNVAMLGISHLNKSNTQEAMQRISGSLAFVAAARSALIVIKDRTDPSRRYFLPLKNNLGRDVGGLAFSIQSLTLPSGIETSHIQWEREAVNLTADEALRVDDDQAKAGERQEAKRFLLDMLANGPILASDAERRCQEDGLSIRTLKRAKKELGIISEKNGAAGWFWKLPTEVADNKQWRELLEPEEAPQTPAENAGLFTV